MNLTPIQVLIESVCITRPCGIRERDLVTLADIAAKIGNVIVHRINYPKALAGKVSRKASLNAKSRPLLSEHEAEDARQTTALVLIATGALHRMGEGGRMNFGDWKEAFRAVRGKDCLRIDRRAKNQSEIVRIDTLSPEAADIAAIREGFPQLPLARRNAIARRARYTRTQIFAAYRADTSRKSRAALRFALRFHRFMLSHYSRTGAFGTGTVTSANDTSGLRHAHERFRAYCAKGEQILTDESLAGIPVKRERELRSFADIPENYAIAA